MNNDKPAETAAFACALTAPASVRAGEPVKVQFKLKNLTAQPLFVLSWRSPLEGLFGNDWRITRDGAEIPYVGPMAKRGDPGADAYVKVEPGAAAEAEVEVSLAYAMKDPGHYKIELRGPLMDVARSQAEVPRTLDKLQPMPIQCPVVETDVTPP